MGVDSNWRSYYTDRDQYFDLHISLSLFLLLRKFLFKYNRFDLKFQRRRKKEPKTNVVVAERNEAGYQASEFPIDAISHLSIISDFESINDWRSEHQDT